MNWIRIDVAIGRDASLGNIAGACGVSRVTATGHVLLVYTAMAEGCRNGDLATISDAVMEEWAQWRGKRGRFAVAFRAELCTQQGVVRSWEKYNGAKLRELESDRDRKRTARESAKLSAGHPPEQPQTSDRRPPLRYETGRNETNNTVQTKVGSNSQLPDIGEAFAIAGPVVARHAHDALRKLLAAQPDPETWARIIVAYASGQSADGGRPTDAGRLAAAVQDYVAQGKHVNGNTGLFRGFVKRAKTPDRGRYNEQTEDERNAEILHDIRAFNERQRMSGDMGLPLKPVPAWANRIDAAFPDGRTHPRQVAA